MSLDLEVIKRKGFKVIKDNSTGANSRVLISEHHRLGKCVIKYAHPEKILYRIDEESVFPLDVAEKIKAGNMNAEVYKKSSHLPNIPKLFDTFELPHFWDVAIAALGFDPKETHIKLPTLEEALQKFNGDYFIGKLWNINPQVKPGQTYTLGQLKALIPVYAIVTQYIEGRDITSANKYQLSQTRVKELEDTLVQIHQIGFSRILWTVDKEYVIEDKESKLWIHDFGTAKSRLDKHFDSYRLEDINEVRRLYPSTHIF